MHQASLFPRWANTGFAVGVGALALLPVAVIAGLMLYVRTPYFTSTGFPVTQPVQFDHRHHVADDGIDCRYCHTTVERSPSAGIPSTSVCMNCHSQIWNQSPLLEPVRASFFSGQPLPFVRVHRVADFVFFNHSIHVKKGVGCVTCHGRLDQMALATQQQPLSMGWCLDCHRSPARNLRPREEVTNMEWKPEGDPVEVGRRLQAAYNVQSLTDCYTCHR